jgi:hypothetical protein
MTFIIQLKRFQNKYGYIPPLKTLGSKFKDNQLLHSIVNGKIVLEDLNNL